MCEAGYHVSTNISTWTELCNSNGTRDVPESFGCEGSVLFKVSNWKNMFNRHEQHFILFYSTELRNIEKYYDFSKKR